MEIKATYHPTERMKTNRFRALNTKKDSSFQSKVEGNSLINYAILILFIG
jgi:hypothetical protein